MEGKDFRSSGTLAGLGKMPRLQLSDFVEHRWRARCVSGRRELAKGLPFQVVQGLLQRHFA